MRVQINISGMAKQGLHPFMLTVFNLQWIESLLYPLRFLLSLFNTRADSDIYNINHNGQVCYLRGLLNDAFDPVERRIRLVDSVHLEYIMFFPEADDKSILFGNVIFPSAQFIGSESADFTVHVPLALNISADQELRMRALLDYYKLVSKRYAIVYE